MMMINDDLVYWNHSRLVRVVLCERLAHRQKHSISVFKQLYIAVINAVQSLVNSVSPMNYLYNHRHDDSRAITKLVPLLFVLIMCCGVVNSRSGCRRLRRCKSRQRIIL